MRNEPKDLSEKNLELAIDSELDRIYQELSIATSVILPLLQTQEEPKQPEEIELQPFIECSSSFAD